ncbi:hypothetical protein P691DRAFT_716838 [Macrolepiota fuliginosa MF-IS2]|uniref:RING-type E3 ubiquitin transferase n=1 Tax=Macrolepiota fuliginosa MF-IS2 TaxID=1400762 RepID=A0A9P5XQ53_9AGAR|nr:hypothetical protein P691DRAFT_716838 [Macrolepiota fuliginosa MF-IS2]
MSWGVAFCSFVSILSAVSVAQPLESFNESLVNVQSDKTWLWGWAWGSESTVSIVDHSPVISYTSRPAAFGAEIDDPILGYVIPLSSFTVPCAHNDTFNLSIPPNTACPALCLNGSHKPTDTWIALVQRGQCEFVKKVREAQKLGAKAVVVGGDDPAISGYPDTLVNMYSPEDSSDIKIAATYIKYSDYMQLYTLIAKSNTTHSGLRTLSLLITAEYSAWEWYSPIITFVVILLLPSILTFITLLIHRIRAARAAQRERAPEDIVRRLPWRVYTGNGWEKHEGSEPVDGTPAIRSSDVDLEEGIPPPEQVSPNRPSTPTADSDGGSTSHSPKEPDQPWFESQLECAICLSDFEKGDKVRVLPCHHIFHLSEIDEWLIQRKKLCPICKADVTQPSQQAPPHTTHSSSVDGSHHDTSSRSPSRAQDATERTPLLLPNNNEEHNDNEGHE